MRQARKNPAFLIALGAVALGIACTTSAPGPCDLADCTEPGDGAVVGDGTLPDGSKVDSGPDAEPPPGCTTPDEPLKNPEKCLVDSFGAYVSPTGDDANPGTKARPFRTLAKAIGAGQARVVVCEGTYSGSVEITRDLSLISGVDCAFSKAGAKAKIVATNPEHGLGIAKPASAVLVRDVEVEAIDGTSASPNSVAVAVNEVGSVKLVGVVATAKKGFDQPAGDSGVTGTVSNLAAIGGTTNGNPATGNTTPGGPKLCMCTVGGNTGGGGGGLPGGDGQNGSPTMGSSGRGGTGGTSCGAGGAGNIGGTATDANPAARPASVGNLSGATWVAGAGIAGDDGKSGQGGGGGGGRDATSAGGGGGCGGCGGSGGKGGAGGGASIALVSVGSAISFAEVSLKAAQGGAGGDGGAGGNGAPGSSGVSGGITGCSAGDGGGGAKGGAASGGAGGISVAIVYKGPKPAGQVVLTFGASGTPGTGGAPGINDGLPGLAQNELEVQ